MQLGMIGLGRMSANMVRRLMRAGHDCVVYDIHTDAVQPFVQEGAAGATSLPAFRAAVDAETTPLRALRYYQYDLNLTDIAEVWLLSAMRFQFGGHLEKTAHAAEV